MVNATVKVSAGVKQDLLLSMHICQLTVFSYFPQHRGISYATEVGWLLKSTSRLQIYKTACTCMTHAQCLCMALQQLLKQIDNDSTVECSLVQFWNCQDYCKPSPSIAVESRLAVCRASRPDHDAGSVPFNFRLLPSSLQHM
jgi:hypothetical protein